jgi:hypothetical protein
MKGDDLFDNIDEWLALSPDEQDARHQAWAARRTAEIRAELGPRYPGDISSVKPTISITNSLGGRSRAAQGSADAPRRERARDEDPRPRDTPETPEHE